MGNFRVLNTIVDKYFMITNELFGAFLILVFVLFLLSFLYGVSLLLTCGSKDAGGMLWVAAGFLTVLIISGIVGVTRFGGWYQKTTYEVCINPDTSVQEIVELERQGYKIAERRGEIYVITYTEKVEE